MNNNRRLRLTTCIDKITEVQEEIQSILDEEDQALDNLPDSLKDGEKGQKMQEGIDELDSAISYLNDAMSGITNVTIT